MRIEIEYEDGRKDTTTLEISIFHQLAPLIYNMVDGTLAETKRIIIEP